jgi:hypothetical protein
MSELCGGYLISSGPPDLSKCHLAGKGAQVAAVGKTSTAILKACNFEGMPCKRPIEALKCEVVPWGIAINQRGGGGGSRVWWTLCLSV